MQALASSSKLPACSCGITNLPCCNQQPVQHCRQPTRGHSMPCGLLDAVPKGAPPAPVPSRRPWCALRTLPSIAWGDGNPCAEGLTVDVSGRRSDAHAVLDGPLGQQVPQHSQQAAPADAAELVGSPLALLQPKAPEHCPLRRAQLNPAGRQGILLQTRRWRL